LRIRRTASARVRAVLIGLWGATLTAYNPVHQADCDKVNEQLKIIADGITALAHQTGIKFDDFFHRYIHSSWWLSIDQLYFLCERARDLNTLSPLGSMTFGSGDLMNEIANSERMGLLKPRQQPGTVPRL
jgi:hypothetical protein